MSTPVTTYDKRPVIVSPTAPTSLEQLRYLWLDISETTPVLRYYNSTGIWEAINGIDTSSFLTTNGVQTITGAKTFNTGTITVADITVDDVTIEGIDTIKLTDDDTHVPTSKLVEDTLVSAISGLETSIDGKLATKANTADVVLKTDISTSIPSAGAVDTKVASEKAVADSLTAKQNTLKYYSETPGDAPSATISVTNINLRGSVAEGYSTTASGLYSHAEGSGTEASGNYSHSEGYNTKASANFQHVLGFYNIEDTNITPYIPETANPVDTKGIYATIIGNGHSIDERSNAQTVSWTGITWSQTDVRAGGTDQDSATHSLAAKQNATDNSLETTDKTIVGAINELSVDKQNTLKYYSESDSSTEPSSNNAQVSILKNSDYGGTLNLGFESSNGIQTINIGGSSNTRNINIGTKICGENNNVTIGNASDGVLLTLNTGRGLAGTGVTKDLSTSATDAQFPTAAAVNSQLILKQNITDNTLTTTAKTIPGAINELKTATDAMVVVSTDNAINVAPTTAQTGVLIASSKTNGGNVIITPKISNTGACYLSTSSTYSNLNPIYPDPTNNKYTYPNLGAVYLFVDNAGDSADIVIENFAD